jgi:hypothetical protein
MESWRPSRWEKPLAATLLFALLAAVHYDVIFLGRSFVLTNHYNPLDYRPLPQNYGEHQVPAETWNARNLYPYANIRDAGGPWWQWEPDSKFLQQSLRDGELPFWDPYIGAGTPAMANMTPGYFFPPFMLMVALGATVTLKNMYNLLLLWSAGFFTFLFLRRHGLHFISALFGGCLVMMCGGVNQHIGTIALQSGACLPAALYVTRLFVETPTRRRAVILSLTYASIALASFPPILFWVFGITALYALTAIWIEASARRLPTFVRWAIATSLAVGLVMFYYFPAFALRSGVQYVLAFYEGVGLESMPFVKILQLLSPTLAGGIPIYLNPPIPQSLEPNLPYTGIAAVMTALLARPFGDARTRTLFLASAVAALVILLKLFGLPPSQWIAHLPLFDQIHYAHYFGIAIGFLLAFLAALGLESVVRGTVSLPRALIAVALPLAATQALWWVIPRGDMLESTADAYWLRDWRVLNAVGIAAACALLVGALRAQARRATAVVVVLVGAVEGAFNNSYPSPDAWEFFDHPAPYVQTLRDLAGMERVMPFGALNANLNSAFGIYSIDSLMTINPPRPYEMYRRYAEPPPWLFLREARRIPPDPVLDRAAIGFLVVRDALPAIVKEAQGRGYQVRFNDGYVWVFERPTLPRFFFSSEYEVRRAPGALTAIATTPSRTVLVEKQPGFPSTPNTANDPRVDVESYRRNSVVLTVDAPRPGLVYASESYFDGWSARLNGAAAAILAANYAFRAIEVPAGNSRIEFHYWPPGLTWGLVVTVGSAMLLGLWAGSRVYDALVPVTENERLMRPDNPNSQSGSPSTGKGIPESLSSAN